MPCRYLYIYFLPRNFLIRPVETAVMKVYFHAPTLQGISEMFALIFLTSFTERFSCKDGRVCASSRSIQMENHGKTGKNRPHHIARVYAGQPGTG